jgi:CRP-like cAMP-binding protein
MHSAPPGIDHLPAPVAARLRALGRPETVPDGAAVLRPGEVDAALVLVEDGSLDAGFGVAAARGALLGEAALLGGQPRAQAVVARGEARVRRIPRQELLSAFAEQPEALVGLVDALRSREAAAGPGEANAAVARLAADALRHRAVRHPYLAALAAGTLPDTRFALADFARHYLGYSTHFPRYLTTVVSRLERPEHRRALLDNLTEESGVYGEDELAALAAWGVQPEWIVGVPHPVLFRRFADALGVPRESGPEADAVVCWREQLLALLAGGSPAEAVGALGLGTETIVRTMYGAFTQALDRVPGLSPRDTVFFPLHTAVDDHHQATLQSIAADFAATPAGRTGLRRGMLKALQLRSAFWDWLYERALDPARADDVL